MRTVMGGWKWLGDENGRDIWSSLSAGGGFHVPCVGFDD
jgi:hypothetical protein